MTYLIKACDYEDALQGKESKFERGENVPLSDLPQELQDNVKDPPESVKKLKEEMAKKAMTLNEVRDLKTEIRASILLTAADYTAAIDEESKVARFEKDKPADPTTNMTEEDAAEWKKQNEEHKDNFKGAAEDEAAKESRFEKDKPVPLSDLPEELQDNVKDPPESVKKLKDEMAKKAVHDALEKTAASGLYGSTKATESACVAGTNRLAKAATKIAKDLYAKDEESPSFLTEHVARRGDKAGSMILKAMEGIGPLATMNKTAGKRSGLYGFGEKTAKLGLTACSELHHEAGLIAGDLFARHEGQHERVAGFLGKHAKAAKCAYSAMLLDAAPKAPVATKLASTGKIALNSQIAAKKVNEILMSIASVSGNSQPIFLDVRGDVEALIVVLKLVAKLGDEDIQEFAGKLGDLMTHKLKPKLANVDPSVQEILAWDTAMVRTSADFLASEEEIELIEDPPAPKC